MEYDFDKIYDRHQTNSVKWDLTQKFFGRQDIIPLWVADMDFRAPEEVIKALVKRAEEGIYGYTDGSDDYYDSFIEWMRNHHLWEIEKEWITYSPGVVPALNGLVQSLTNSKDKILIQSPVYPPFFRVIENHGRILVNNQLILNGDKYTIDFKDLEQKFASGVNMLILCNPHNPVGRVWERHELEILGQLCLKYNVLVISDEIHCDLIYEGYKHVPFASLSEQLADRTIVCTAPSKTFNLAGLQSSSIIIPNPELRKAFRKFQADNGIHYPNVFGMIAQRIAYKEGGEWLEQLIKYIEGNYNFLSIFLKQEMPQIKLIKPEGTYLAWLDFGALDLSTQDLQKFLIHKAGVGLNAGYTFGPGGEGFARLNLASPRSLINEGLIRIKNAMKEGK